MLLQQSSSVLCLRHILFRGPEHGSYMTMCIRERFVYVLQDLRAVFSHQTPKPGSDHTAYDILELVLERQAT